MKLINNYTMFIMKLHLNVKEIVSENNVLLTTLEK